MSPKTNPKKTPPTGGYKLIATNPDAKRNYQILEVIEAGLVLTGTEIKSLRQQSPNIKESYVNIRLEKRKLQAWWVNATIPIYSHGNIWNHEPKRDRKLLLHRKEIDRLYGAVSKKGLTLVPTRIYLKKGKAKLEVGFGKGKKLHDKRETIKRRTAEREMERATRRR